MTQAKHTKEIEYSKLWAEKNPSLFSESILGLLEQHPAEYWELSINQTGGFFTIRASIKSGSAA